MRSLCTSTKSSPCLPQLEKAHLHQWRPSTAKKNNKQRKHYYCLDPYHPLIPTDCITSPYLWGVGGGWGREVDSSYGASLLCFPLPGKLIKPPFPSPWEKKKILSKELCHSFWCLVHSFFIWSYRNPLKMATSSFSSSQRWQPDNLYKPGRKSGEMHRVLSRMLQDQVLAWPWS